jgi:hypothetical protein
MMISPVVWGVARAISIYHEFRLDRVYKQMLMSACVRQ